MASQPLPDPQDDEPAGGEAMSDEELAGILDEHAQRAIGYFESEIASEQADALDRYYRRAYGDERPGRSSVVDGTVAITVDNALAAILKPFVSADETVVFEPRSAEDVDQADQATEYVNYVLHQDNCGFLILHDWFKDALLQKLGVVKVYWEDKTRTKVVRLENLDPMQVEAMQQDGSLIDVYGPDENGLYTADVNHTEPDGKLCIENVPPEEYRISPYARPGRIPPYEAHVTRKTKSELLSLGFDREVVMGLSKVSNTTTEDTRSLARYEDEQWDAVRADTVGTEANDLVDFNDEFALVDFDRDGIAELRRVMRSGNVVLYNEEADYGAFARLCPAPMPHKIYGLSLADQVKDEQRIATVLMRQTLDNLYLSNNPRPVLGQGAERDDGTTIDDLLSDAPGAIIRAKDGGQLGDFSVPFVADKSFPMLAYVEQQAEARTGISKQGQGMDPDALSTAGQVTATQAAIMEDGRNSRAEMIARIFAETGVRDLFRLMLKILVAHQPRARMVRLRNKWVEMDPREWNSDMDLSISVGLGMGSKAEQITTAQSILETMKEVGMTPFASLIDKEKVYNALKKLYTAAGIKNITDYLNEPQRDEQGNLVPDPPQPDPEQQKLQSQMQVEQMKLQMQQQAAAAKQQNDQLQVIAQAHLDAAKAQHDAEVQLLKLQLEQQKATAEAAMNEQKMRMEAALNERKMQLQEDAHQRDAERQDRVAEVKISQNREGGDLSK